MSAAGVRKDCTHPRANHQHGHYLAYEKDGCRCSPCVVANGRQDKLVRYRTATGTHTYVPADRARAHVEQLLETLTLAQIEHRSGIHRTAIRVLVGSFPGRPASKRITRTSEQALLAVRGDRVGSEQHGLVDGTGTRRRFRALVALGWPARTMSARLGLSSRTTWTLTREDKRPVIARTRDAVLRLYDELSLTIPPRSAASTRARRLALERGWAPPLAWDDDSIDDPAARPWTVDVETDDYVDAAKVERAVTGECVELTRAERWLAVRRLATRGMSDRAIAEVVGVSERTVLRDRQDCGIESTWSAA